jgi:hypothetical protein
MRSDMRRLAFTIAFAMFSGIASAQISAPEQRMYWFNLQRLATETTEIENCEALNSFDAKYRDAYYRAAADTAVAIEKYIARYPNGQWELESPDAYRYRVWSVAMRVGMQKARSSEQLKSTCALFLTR